MSAMDRLLGGFTRRRVKRSPSPAPNTSHSTHSGDDAPPGWAAATEPEYADGLFADASPDEYEQAEDFCRRHAQEPPALLSSQTCVRIGQLGCAAWGVELADTPPGSRSSTQLRAETRFVGTIENLSNHVSPRNEQEASDKKGKQSDADAGTIRVKTDKRCKDVCLLSDLPISAGLYDASHNAGVYFEITLVNMDDDAAVSIGTACKPCPPWRLPGWNRLSAGWHLDDLRKFFENPNGGQDYNHDSKSIVKGDVIGCGLSFPPTGRSGSAVSSGNSASTIFFTHNGVRLPAAFTGVYTPREAYDVYAAVGVSGKAEIMINFGADHFRWKEGDQWQWRMDQHVGRRLAGTEDPDEALPAYTR